MIDLYGLYRDFPALEESEGFRQNPYKRISLLEDTFARDISDPRFSAWVSKLEQLGQ